MTRWGLGAALAVLLTLALAVPASGARLDAYSVKLSGAKHLRVLKEQIDLSRYAGKQVEVSIVYATDWGTLTVPGMLVDDTTVTVDGNPVAQTSFETDEGGWSVPGAHPAGPSSNLNDWIRSQRIFEDAAVTKSDFGLFFGFGFEGVDGRANRAELMRRTVSYLLQ